MRRSCKGLSKYYVGQITGSRIVAGSYSYGAGCIIAGYCSACSLIKQIILSRLPISGLSCNGWHATVRNYVAAYYYIGRWAELSARSGSFNAVLAAWLPNILGVIGMTVMLVRFRDRAA